MSSEEKIIKKNVLTIITNLLKIFPKEISTFCKKSLISLNICKIFEDSKFGNIEERIEAFKLIMTWMTGSIADFPLIFSLSMVSIIKSLDEKKYGEEKDNKNFKKSCIEYLRNLAILNPFHCQKVGGFQIIINSILEGSLEKYGDCLLHTMVFILNSPQHRFYLGEATELLKIFNVYTISDYTDNQKDRKNENQDEKQKLLIQIENSTKCIMKLIKTWPGYFLLFSDRMTFKSVIQSLNSDSCDSIKLIILDMLIEIFNFFEAESIENVESFNIIVNQNHFYINKVYFAYIIYGLKTINLYDNLNQFIEKNPTSNLLEKAKDIRLRFLLLYSKLSNDDIIVPESKNKFYFDNISTDKDDDQNNDHLINLELNKLNENLLDNRERIKSYDKIENVDSSEQLIQQNVKTMDLLDEKYQYYSHQMCNTEPTISNIKNYSDAIILSKELLLFSESSKKYKNEYAVELSKKELFDIIEEEDFNNLIRSSNINKGDVSEWKWNLIDELLEIAVYNTNFSKFNFL